MTALDRLKRHFTLNAAGCWHWTGPIDRHGYGRFTMAGETWLAHRAAWTLINGPIPAGMVLNHCCRNRACCNPLHLMLISRFENTMIGLSPPACNARKTRCQAGHEFDEANTYRHRRRRCCRACNKIAVHRYKEKFEDERAFLERLAEQVA